MRLRQYTACASYWYDEAYLLLNVFRRSFGDLTGAVDYQVVTPLRRATSVAAPVAHQFDRSLSDSHATSVQRVEYYYQNHHRYAHRDWDRDHHRWHYHD